MVNFGAPDTIQRYRQRKFHVHNPQVTLMRTTPERTSASGWIGEKLNRMDGPVRFFLPEGGVSALDAPGQPFWDPEADAALFGALERSVRQTSNRQAHPRQAPHQRTRLHPPSQRVPSPGRTPGDRRKVAR